MALYRYKTNGNGFASVVAWLALLIPMWAAKAAAHHVAAESERKRKEKYRDEVHKLNKEKSESREELSSSEKCLATENPVAPTDTMPLQGERRRELSSYEKCLAVANRSYRPIQFCTVMTKSAQKRSTREYRHSEERDYSLRQPNSSAGD